MASITSVRLGLPKRRPEHTSFVLTEHKDIYRIMADVAVPAPAAAATPKKSKAKAPGTKKPKAKASHPPTADMVNKAIKELKERGGSSLQAIKKYISSNYKVDAEKMAPFIKKYIKGAVTSGKLVQTKGKGASGSFKLASKDKAEKAPTKPKAVKKKAVGPAKEKKPKPAAAKKAPAVKKAVAAKKKSAAAKKPKSPSKAKKVAKAPVAAKKPKAKKAVAKKSSKKAAPKKK